MNSNFSNYKKKLTKNEMFIGYEFYEIYITSKIEILMKVFPYYH